MAKRIIEELRDKHPVMAKRAKKSRAAAIKMHCIECCGGDRREVRICSDTLCALYPFRLGYQKGLQKVGDEQVKIDSMKVA